MIDRPLSDAGVGRAVLATRFFLTLHAARLALLLGAIPGFLIPYIVWMIKASRMDVAIVKLNLWSYLVPDHLQLKWKFSSDAGLQVLTIKDVRGNLIQSLTPGQFRESVHLGFNKVLSGFSFIGIVAILTSLLGYFIVWYMMDRYGKSRQIHRRIRGANEIVTSDELSDIVKSKGKSNYAIAGVPLPSTAPMAGILIEGAQGTGKSILIHDLMVQVMARRKKLIIYDQNGEFFKAYYRPGKDFFFNPALDGSVAWSLFNEITYKYDSNTLAHAFLPPKSGISSGPNAFFEDAARTLFSTVLLRLAQRGAVNTADIAKAIYSISDEELDVLIRNSVASSSLGGDSKAQRQGVISSIAIYLDGIASVKPGDWTIRNFLERDDDSRFFILNTDDTKAMFAPLFRLLLTVAFDGIASKGQTCHEDKFWFFLDETHTVGDIKLDEHLAQKRKFGVCIVSGIQSGSQFNSSMGEERANTVLNCFNTLVALRTNEPNSQQRIASHLGKIEFTTVNQNQALSVTQSRDTSVLNQNEQEKWSVHPADIGRLPNCVGFIKLAGDFPVAKIDYQRWVPTNGKSSRGYRVDRFSPVNSMPKRDESFMVVRVHHDDPIGSIADDLKKTKEDDANAANWQNADMTSPVAVKTDQASIVQEIMK